MIKKVHNSFIAAFNGFRETIIFERNLKIMFVVTVLVIAAMFYFPTSRLEKIILLITIFSVLILELINSIVEKIMDVITLERDERVRVIKDMMAAIVLLASFGAALIGALIFLPHIFNY